MPRASRKPWSGPNRLLTSPVPQCTANCSGVLRFQPILTRADVKPFAYVAHRAPRALDRSYRRSQQADKVDEVVLAMQAHGHIPNFAARIHVLMAHVDAGNLGKAWRYGCS